MLDYEYLQRQLSYSFKNKALLKTALTHASYANEHNVKSYQRLEFLGDAVIELIITTKLYHIFNGDEGELSKYRASLVNEPSLSFVLEELKLDKCILKGKGENRNVTDSLSIKCDVLEAIVGAMYLDGGYDIAEKFVLNCLKSQLDSLVAYGLKVDAKSALQELMPKAKIIYSTTKHGNDHNPLYKCTVILNGVNCGFGSGPNKKSAQQMAAQKSIEQIKNV